MSRTIVEINGSVFKVCKAKTGELCCSKCSFHPCFCPLNDSGNLLCNDYNPVNGVENTYFELLNNYNLKSKQYDKTKDNR